MEQVGILFVAGGADAYLAALTANTTAEQKLGAAAATAVPSINALDSSQGNAAKAAGAMGMNIDTATGKVTFLGTESDIAAADVIALGGAADDTAKYAGDLGTKAADAGKASEDLGEKGKKGADGLGFLDRAAKGAQERLGEMVTEGLATAGQAILQFLGDSVTKAGDFEQQMGRFASVTGSSLAESGLALGDFKDLFISLGRELPVSTSDVQQAAIEMAKGGIEPATIAAGGLRDVLNLAAAGEVDIGKAAEIAANQLGIWVSTAATAEEKAAFLTRSSDLMAQAANASTLSVDDLALGLANTGGVARIAGLSFDETVTTMALLRPGFAGAADAGTALKTMLTRLQPSTTDQAEAMAELGLLTAEGTSKFYDAEGSFIGMDAAADLLQDSLAGMSEAQKTAALQAIFGQDAFRAAAILAEQGGEGYNTMTEAMAGAGTASEQAAAKQQGFNVAMDGASGALEALQITATTVALPALTDLVNFFSGRVNAVTDFVQATIDGDTFLNRLAETASDIAVPALLGIGSALAAYALVQATQAVPAILASIPAIVTQTGVLLANTAAALLAAAPYAIIAAAIGGVAWAFQDFNQKTSDLTTQLLESREWWNKSTEAITDYGEATGIAKDKLAPYAGEITAIREQLQSEIKSLGERDAAGLVSDEQRATEQQHINDLAGALKGATDRYTDQKTAIAEAQAASLTATEQAGKLTEGTAILGEAVALTADDFAKLGQKIQDTFTKGGEVLGTYAQTYSDFASGVEDRSAEFSEKMAELEKQKQDATTEEQKTGIDDQIEALKTAYADQELAAAESYAAQQKAQQAHLGQLLIDYTVAQATLGNISKEKAAEITAALEIEYGLQESSTATTFLNMAGSIDRFAGEAGGSIDSLIGDLRENQTAAKDTQKAMDDYAKEYAATQVNNFLDGKADADDYISSLERIPSNVETTLTITTERREAQEEHRRGEQSIEGRAVGGGMEAMRPYLVGEQGMEIVTPTTASYVTPADAVQRAMASQAQMSTAMGGSSWSNSTIINVDARGSNLSMADVTMAVQAGLAAEGRSADVRTRMGVQ
jgi:TP901 family phage tail tape measure protein